MCILITGSESEFQNCTAVYSDSSPVLFTNNRDAPLTQQKTYKEERGVNKWKYFEGRVVESIGTITYLDKMGDSNKINAGSEHLKYKFSGKGKSKRNLDFAGKRHDNILVGKTVSCSELSTSCLKTSSYSNLESNSMFFNEKGWPVKVMRVAEISPQKGNNLYIV